MAWRDSRRNRGRLFLFVAAIIAGIAALTAVRSFSYNLNGDIDREAKSLLGADLMLDRPSPAPDSLLLAAAGPNAERSDVVSFVSMVRFPRTNGTRLSQIRALRGDYPFYGQWLTQPADAGRTFRTGRRALVERALMLQFGIHPGDSIQIGDVKFLIEGELLSAPGRSGIAASVAPVVFIPLDLLDSTGLIQRGSRVQYQYLFKLPPGDDPEARIEPIKDQLDEIDLDWETVESRKKNIGTAFANFTTFLNLVGFVALLLGCIGVAGAVHLYVKDKRSTVAILRFLGASGRKAFLVYLVQVTGIGFIGALAGAFLGAAVQKLLPWIAADLLPIQDVSSDISWIATGQGVLLGLAVSVLFALLPLAGILRTSPLQTLRAAYGEGETDFKLLRFGVYALLTLAVGGFTWWLVRDLEQVAAFLGGLAAAFAILFAISWLVTYLLRRFFPKKWSFVWRQSIANLFRPENQTRLLIVVIGLGAMLLSTLFLVQSMLLRQLEFSGSGHQPNLILFDIQTADRDSVLKMVEQANMPVIQTIPVVTMRLETYNGKTKTQDLADSTIQRDSWIWNFEFRVTFRDTLVSTETVAEGTWTGLHDGQMPVKISISDNMQRNLKAKLGDRMVFNIQGTRMETEIASIRRVSFNQIQPAFAILFPKGILEPAPQIHVVISRTANTEQSAAFQSAMVKRYPSVSALDLTQILKSVDEVLSKISFVIQFMALFSILTGLLVLVSSIYQTRYARLQESVLLRTLGASRRQILAINALEYGWLGSLACLSGLILSIGGAWALARFAFNIDFYPVWWPLGLMFVVITGLTVAIGLISNRDVLRKPPLEILRT